MVTKRPVNRGTESEPNWAVESRPFEPTELTIRNLIRESLPTRVTVVQAEAPVSDAAAKAVLTTPCPIFWARLRQRKPWLRAALGKVAASLGDAVRPGAGSH